ncbi:MAG: hypothetical protein V5A34_00520 [Halapricum sp.]
MTGNNESISAAETPSRTSEEESGRTGALKRTLRFTYHHSTVLVPLSVLWFFTSLPLVTAGPATLGAYATVLSLRETGEVDRGRVLGTIRRNLVHSILLGLLPPVFLGIATVNAIGGGSSLVAVLALYVGTYLAVVLVPTFVGLAQGRAIVPALREGYIWTANNPAVAVHLVVVTIVVTVAAAFLTIGFVLLFAGLLATYHMEIIYDDAPAVDPGTGAAEVHGVLS